MDEGREETSDENPIAFDNVWENTQSSCQRILPDSNLVAFGGIDIEAQVCQPLLVVCKTTSVNFRVVVTTCRSYGEPPNQVNLTALDTSIHFFEC